MSAQMPTMDWTFEPLCDSFSAFQARLILFFEDQSINDKIKQSIKFRIAVGDQGIRRINSSGLSDADKKDPKKLYELLSSQLDPQRGL